METNENDTVTMRNTNDVTLLAKTFTAYKIGKQHKRVMKSYNFSLMQTRFFLQIAKVQALNEDFACGFYDVVSKSV